ncbi:MAG: hypothetical protein ACLR2O_08325 [Coprococcus sp.]
MEMKNVYKSLNEQKLYYEQELIRKKNVLKDTKEEKRKTLQLKKIHGELYYYAQCKRAGKVNSQYLGPVIPGTIADIEEKQNKIECLTEEIKELEWNIESLEKMMEYYKKREKKNLL